MDRQNVAETMMNIHAAVVSLIRGMAGDAKKIIYGKFLSFPYLFSCGDMIRHKRGYYGISTEKE